MRKEMRNSYFYIYKILSKWNFITFIFVFFLLANVFAQPPGAGNSLNFDGWGGTDGEYVDMGQNSNLQISDEMTFEAWVYIDGAAGIGNIFNVVACGTNGEDEGDNNLYELYYEEKADERLRAYYFHEYGNGQNIVKVDADATIAKDQWVHLAFSRDDVGYNPKVLITYDGMRETPGEGFAVAEKPTGGEDAIFVLGGGFGDDPGEGDIPISSKYLDGRMDEVRVWNTAVSFWDIRDWMNRRLTPDHPNYDDLVAYWKLDEDLDDENDNAEDSQGDNDGTLTNMELGVGGDRILSTAPIGDASIFAVYSYMEDLDTTTYADISATEEVPIDVTFTLGPTMYEPLAVIQVNTAPNNTTGIPTDHNFPNTYWELWSRNGFFYSDVPSNFTATVRFHYDYIVGIGDETTLNLYRRDDVNGSWSDLEVSPVYEGSTTDGDGYFEIVITQATSGGFSGQYIITSPSGENPLPVELATFTAHLVDEGVKLEWVTHGEVNNLGFELWRAMDNDEKYQMISSYQNNRRLVGAGNSNTTRYYQYIDKNVQEGHDYYYQLWDVSYSGERNSYGPISLSINSAGNFPENYTLYQNYPNPFNPLTYIRFQIHQMNFHGDKIVQVNLDIYDLLGKKIKSLMNSDLHIGDYTYSWDGTNDLGHRVASGTYVYTLRLGNHIVSKKLVLIR